MKDQSTDRREFLKAAGALGALTILDPRMVRGSAAKDVRTLVLILFLLAMVLARPSVGIAGSAKVQVFSGDMNQVFDATVKAIEKNWKKIKSSDRPTGTIRFHTGVSVTTWGEDCTAVLRNLGDGKVEVALQSTNSAQVYAWGVGGRIAKKLFNSIQDELATSSPGTKAQSPIPPTQK